MGAGCPGFTGNFYGQALADKGKENKDLQEDKQYKETR